MAARSASSFAPYAYVFSRAQSACQSAAVVSQPLLMRTTRFSSSALVPSAVTTTEEPSLPELQAEPVEMLKPRRDRRVSHFRLSCSGMTMSTVFQSRGADSLITRSGLNRARSASMKASRRLLWVCSISLKRGVIVSKAVTMASMAG